MVSVAFEWVLILQYVEQSKIVYKIKINQVKWIIQKQIKNKKMMSVIIQCNTFLILWKKYINHQCLLKFYSIALQCSVSKWCYFNLLVFL